MEKHVLGFIGAGQMATAIIRGVFNSGNAKSGRVPKILAYDVNPTAVDTVSKLGVQRATSPEEVVTQSSLIFLAVKPHIIKSVLPKIHGKMTQEKTVVSVAAGIPLSAMEQNLPPSSQTIRVMPNTPCLVGEGCTALSPGEFTRRESLQAVSEIFSALGVVVEVQEGMLDAVTALSGSGPAYIFMLIDALADGGVRAGLPREIALPLATQLVKGSATLVEKSKTHPMVLKDRVTSAGGTTISGVHALENGGYRSAVMDAVFAAYQRSLQLAKS